jgi:hypothetical protein
VILLAHELDRSDGHAWVPVLSVLLLHLHRYALELLTKPDGNFPYAATLYDIGAVLQPGMWGTFLLVGLIGVRVTEHASVPDPRVLLDSDG